MAQGSTFRHSRRLRQAYPIGMVSRLSRRVRRRQARRRLQYEVLERRWLLAGDFGDAPAPYPTSLADRGAQHADLGPMLGFLRDREADGQPTAAADGDGADEDGVTLGAMQAGELGASVTVHVQNAPLGAKLDAWIDFNGDGNWGGPFETIADSLSVVEGDNLVRFDVPTWANAGDTYGRFRLSTAGDLAVSGPASDGEVEDFQLPVNPPSVATGSFTQRIVTAGASAATSVFAADIDGDGDQDLLSASTGDDTIAWYENDGREGFTARIISSTADNAKNVFAADVDGDGDVDVLSASLRDDKIAWYENDGIQNFTEHSISVEAKRARSVFAADVDGDGDLDVLSASRDDDKIAWYENDGSQTFVERTISTNANGAASVFAADVDGDGDMDVLSASYIDGKIAWYENDRSQNFTERVISTSAAWARSVFAADLDGDGDLDVLSASRNDDTIAWHENDGSQNFTERVVSTTADGAYSVLAADVDGDGDLDVLSGSIFDDKIAWYENDGGENFRERVISHAADGAVSVFAADIDGDGDLDVLSASYFDDQIAWYENLDRDFGDAPAPYPTLRADQGAQHAAVGPTLGARRDAEGDGQPTAAADGDGLDDDGITFDTIMAGRTGASATVHVQNAPAGAKLDAWIDFNGDGNWGGPAEQIADRVAVFEGDNRLHFDVPSWAREGDSYARFRLSQNGDLPPTGFSAEGEVEDYRIAIVAPAAATGEFGGQQVIGQNRGSQSVFAADVDGDGDTDVLSASLADDKIAWYENDGRRNFTEHTISTSADSARNVFAADVDGDGDTDVLSASRFDDKIAWYENDGSQNFTEHAISTAADSAQSVFAADVDGDGDMDVLSASRYDDKIAWYENDGSQNFTTHTISTDADLALSVFAADVDSDGDLDVLSASLLDDKVAWYENDGQQNFTARTISTAADGPVSIFAADMDGDGDVDVLSASHIDNKVAWYENDGQQNFTDHTISTTAVFGRSVFAADVDGDGDQDVLSASLGNNRIAWYENDGSQHFAEHTISSTTNHAKSVFAADLDGDGDLDVLSASEGGGEIAWYEQISVDFGDAAELGYPTSLSSNGARHQIVAGFHLGTSVDSELDGQPSLTSSGDDSDGLDDEDGVSAAGPLVVSESVWVTVNASAPGFLDAWIDWNADGDWEDSSEQILTSAPAVAGDNPLLLSVPEQAAPGVTYARFRFSSTGGLTPRGPALDGEVEDYPARIFAAAPTARLARGSYWLTAPASGPYPSPAQVDGERNVAALDGPLNIGYVNALFLDLQRRSDVDGANRTSWVWPGNALEMVKTVLANGEVSTDSTIPVFIPPQRSCDHISSPAAADVSQRHARARLAALDIAIAELFDQSNTVWVCAARNADGVSAKPETMAGWPRGEAYR